MRFDLLTLYYLAIGTLLVSAGLTLWEVQSHHPRRRELHVLAAGYAALAAGCLFTTIRGQMSGFLGAAISNITMVAGYLLILHGVTLRGPGRYRAVSIGFLLALTIAWAVGGGRWSDGLWSYLGGIPIGAASAMTAWALLRNDHWRPLRSNRVAASIALGHAIFYAGRVLVLPWVVAASDLPVLSIAGKLTMYEGVLYSVALPMALLAMIREEAHAQLLEASRTDYLTGLGNRQWFFEQGERLIRARGADQALSLLAFDLDHFKAINDRHGHATGDEVLRLFAHTARNTAGPGAVVARIGGEEFVALLPGQSRLHARETGQALAARFSDTVVQDSRCTGVSATVSIGLAEFGCDGTGLSALLSAADRALYLAKSRGRNRIELAAPMALAAC